MKKVTKWLSAAVFTLFTVMMFAVTTFADDDICLFEGECRSPRSWGQAFDYNFNDESESIPFSLSQLNEKSKLFVEFELESEPHEGFVGLEFILYKRKSADAESIWARVEPSEIVDGVAVFEYADMVEAVGSDDLTIIDSIYVGDTDNGLLVKKVTFDVNGDNDLTGSANEEAEKDDTQEENTTQKADESSSESTEEGSGGVNIILIVVIAVVVIAAVVVVLVLKNRKKYY